MTEPKQSLTATRRVVHQTYGEFSDEPDDCGWLRFSLAAIVSASSFAQEKERSLPG